MSDFVLCEEPHFLLAETWTKKYCKDTPSPISEVIISRLGRPPNYRDCIKWKDSLNKFTFLRSYP